MVTLVGVEGRLAALEAVASYLLYKAGRDHYGSTWSQRMEARIIDATSRATEGLSGDAAASAEASVRSMFTKSADDTLWPVDN